MLIMMIINLEQKKAAMYAAFIFTIGVENSYVIKRYTVALGKLYSVIDGYTRLFIRHSLLACIVW